jgi:Arc/MetJ family transcription regulator
MTSVARTNIDIDEDLLARAMSRYGYKTKREAVDAALREAAAGTR